MRKIWFLFLVVFALNGCKQQKTIYEIDDELIREYLAKTNINAIKDDSGMYYYIEEEGTGPHPTPASYIDVSCTGYHLDSVVFRSPSSSVRGQLSGYMLGWQYGLPYFRKGGKGKLFIPRYLGNPTTNQVLVFDIELKNVW